MIAVIFELQPEAGQSDAYFATAADLKPLVEGVDGFISVERFQSVNDPGKYLSLSFWRDEESVRTWRNLTEHRQAQQVGRGGIFRDYRLRVAEVIRDYGMDSRDQRPRG